METPDIQIKTILQHAPDAVVTIRSDGSIISWNLQATAIFGWEEQEVMGKALSETIIPHQYRKQHDAGMRHYLNTGEGPVINRSIEITALTKDHREFPVELKISASILNGEHIFIGFIRDISVRKKAQELLQQKTQQLEEAQQLAHIGSWEWDVKADMIQWSDELYRIYGLTRDTFETNYNNFLLHVHPADKTFVDDTIRKAFSDQQPYQFFHRIIRADGTERVVSSTGKVITNPEGIVVKMAGTAQDVTEQKRHEAELIESEDRYHRMVGQVEDYAIIYLNTNGVIKNWNKGAEKIKGYTAEEIIGKKFSVFYTAEDIDKGLPDELLAYAKTHGVTKHEGWRIRKDGNLFWGSTVITALQDENANIIGFSKVTRDLTDKKDAEDQISRYLAQLNEKNEALEKMNAELKSFAYVSSHDLQEPLRKIQVFANQILEEEYASLSDKARDYFMRMGSAASRMQKLIKDLLEYSSTSAHNAEFEEIHMSKIIDELREEFKEQFEEKGARLETDLSCNAAIIPFQFRQLMHNLLTNALKFSKPGVPPVITIRSAQVSGISVADNRLLAGKQYCHLSISDNGIGFAPEYRERIFEVFQRLHGKNTYSGTGIGLAIVKKIVDNHKGIITAMGEEGKGARFDIYIPQTV